VKRKEARMALDDQSNIQTRHFTSTGETGNAVSAKEKRKEKMMNERKLQSIPIELLKTPEEPSREVYENINALASTIRTHGLLQPLVVRKLKETNGFEIVVGSRRYEACKKANLRYVPCLVFDGELSNEQYLEMSIIENLQREDLRPYEEIRLIRRLKGQFELTNAELAAKLGVSSSLISTYLTIGEALPPNVQKQIVHAHAQGSPTTLTITKAALLARANLSPEKLKEMLRLLQKAGLTRNKLAKRLAGVHKKKIRRVAQARVFWKELTKSLKEFQRYWDDYSTLKEWETVSEYRLTLDVALPRDLGEDKQ